MPRLVSSPLVYTCVTWGFCAAAGAQNRGFASALGKVSPNAQQRYGIIPAGSMPSVCHLAWSRMSAFVFLPSAIIDNVYINL